MSMRKMLIVGVVAWIGWTYYKAQKAAPANQGGSTLASGAAGSPGVNTIAGIGY